MAENALIDHVENEIEIEQDDRVKGLKDTKYSWLVCACTFFSQVFVLGLLHAFGVFFVEFVREFSSSKGTTAWIGSLAYGLSMLFGPVTSLLVNRYGYRIVMMIGGFICACSVFASSFATALPHLFISFSVFYGIGTSMCTGPTMIIAPEYFDKYLTTAVGITVSGSSFGTLIMGPFSQFLIDSIGWRHVFRIFAGLDILTIFMNSRIKPLRGAQRVPSVESIKKAPGSALIKELKLWKNRVFIIWTTAITLVMFGFYIPYMHLVSYTIDMGISQDKASMLIMVLGACTAVGRLMFGRIVQIGVLNRLHMHQVSMVITGTGVLVLPLIKSYAGILMYVITVGLVDGCFVVLLPILTTSLVGIENSVLAWGFLVGVSSVTFTLGPPIAGMLYDLTGTYDIAFHCAGVPVIAGAVILFLIPWAQRTSSSTNVMEIVNEYAISDGFDSAFNTDQADRRSDSGNTVCGSEVGSRSLTTVDKSGLSVRSVGTSPIPRQLADKSTITENTPNNRFSMDVEDALSILSYNDKVFSDMLKTSQDNAKEASYSSYGQTRSVTSDRSSVSDIGRRSGVGPVRGPEDETAPGSVHSPRQGSQRDDSSLPPSLLQQFSSHSTQLVIGSSGMFLPTANQPFSVELPGSGTSSVVGPPSLLSSPGPSQSRAESDDPSQQSSNFDQAISDQVEKLRETLRSPTPEQSSTSNTSETDKALRVKSPVTSCGTSNQSESILPSPGPSPVATSSRCDAPPMSHSSSSKQDSVQQSPSPAKVPEPTSETVTTFETDNQVTVIRGTNPFVTKPKSSDETTTPPTRLQDLFKAHGSNEESGARTTTQTTSSYEVVSVSSQDNADPKPATSGELDVFTHLFDDSD